MSIQNILKRFRDSAKNNIKLYIYSFIIAIIVWFFVCATVYPDETSTFKDVPINIDLTGTSAERSGLSLVDQDIQNVTITIKGSRAVIGNLKSSDFVAKPVIENITAAGDYPLALEIVSESGKEFEVNSIRPSTVNVNLDKYISSAFTVEAEAPNVSAEEGYMKGDITASPNVVTITGPEEQINKITRCVVRTNYGKDKDPLTESYEVTSGNQLILYNGDTILETDGLQIAQTDFSISVQIYMKKTLDFKITFTNVPSGFPIDDLEYTLDATSIDVSAPNGYIEDITEFNLGYVDLRTVDIGSVIQFPVTLPTGYQNLSGIENVNVSFQSEGLAKKQLYIKNKEVSFINAPSNYDITAVTGGQNVTFIGPKDVIEKLTAEDVVSQVDLLGITIQTGSYFSNPISYIVTNKGCVWAYGSYTSTFVAKEK